MKTFIEIMSPEPDGMGFYYGNHRCHRIDIGGIECKIMGMYATPVVWVLFIDSTFHSSHGSKQEAFNAAMEHING